MVTRVVDFDESPSAEVDEIVDELADEIVVASARALRVLAADGDARLPHDPASLEHLLVGAAGELDRDDRAALVRRDQAIRADPQRALGPRRSALLESIDLRSAESVLAQLDPGVERLRPTLSDFVSALQPPRSTLTWRVNRVACVTETGLTAHGEDHLYIGGVVIDAFGNTSFAGVHDLGGGWDSGNELAFDQDIAISDLSYGTGWERAYHAMLAISVRGTDTLYKILDWIVKTGRDKVVEVASAAAGAAAGAWAGAKAGALIGTPGGPGGVIAGAIVGAAVGFVVGYVLKKVIDKVWGEISGYFKGSTKLFDPIGIEMTIPRHGAPSDGNTLTLTWTGHGGEYQIGVDGRLDWISDVRPGAVSPIDGHLLLATTWGISGLRVRRWPGEQGWTASVKANDANVSTDTPVTVVQSSNIRADLLATAMNDRLVSARYQSNLLKPLDPTDTGWDGALLPEVPGGALTGAFVGATSRDRHLVDAFIVGRNGTAYTAASGPHTAGDWHGWWEVPGGTWLPGSPINAVSRAKGFLDIFAIGWDGRVSTNSYRPVQGDSWEWTGWFPIFDDQFIAGAHVTALSRKTNMLDVFAVTLDGHVRTASWSPDSNAGKWAGWARVPEDSGQFTPGSPVSPVSRQPDMIDLFVVGLDGRIWTSAWGPQTSYKWSGWSPIGDAVFAQGSLIAATSRGPENIDLFVGGFDGNVWSAAWDGNWDQFVI